MDHRLAGLATVLRTGVTVVASQFKIWSPHMGKQPSIVCTVFHLDSWPQALQFEKDMTQGHGHLLHLILAVGRPLSLPLPSFVSGNTGRAPGVWQTFVQSLPTVVLYVRIGSLGGRRCRLRSCKSDKLSDIKP